MDKNFISPQLLAKYQNGACSPEEIILVEKWYDAIDKGNAAAEGKALNQPDHLKKIQRIIAAKQLNDARELATSERTSFRSLLNRYAAAAMFLLVSGLGIYFYSNHKESNMLEAASEQAVTFKNTNKFTVKHQLPDGSTVWLNPKAVLRYSRSSFSSATREVMLTGEAFFDVVKDPSHPFLVRSNRLLVKVLGTSFNVRAEPEQDKYEVSVVTGKVYVSDTKNESAKSHVTLIPLQKAVFEVATGSLDAAAVSGSAQYTETWQPVSLTFEDEKLRDVAVKLEKKFGVNIRMSNADLNNCFIKSKFENSRLSEILETITQMLNASYEMDGNLIVIKGTGCANTN